MKSLFIVSFVLTLFSIAKADVPPPPGSVVKATIEGASASILFNSMNLKISDLPTEFQVQKDCQGKAVTHSKGKLLETTSGKSKITIACTAYYCLGHGTTCKMEQKY